MGVGVGSHEVAAHIMNSVRKIRTECVRGRCHVWRTMSVVVPMGNQEPQKKVVPQRMVRLGYWEVAAQLIVSGEVLFTKYVHSLGLGVGFVPCQMIRDTAILGGVLLLWVVLIWRSVRKNLAWTAGVPWSPWSEFVCQALWARVVCICLRVAVGIAMSHPRIQTMWRYMVPVSMYSSMWATRHIPTGATRLVAVIERWVVFGYTQNTIGTYLVWAGDVCWSVARCVGIFCVGHSVVARCILGAYMGALTAEVLEVLGLGRCLQGLELLYVICGVVVAVCVVVALCAKNRG